MSASALDVAARAAFRTPCDDDGVLRIELRLGQLRFGCRLRVRGGLLVGSRLLGVRERRRSVIDGRTQLRRCLRIGHVLRPLASGRRRIVRGCCRLLCIARSRLRLGFLRVGVRSRPVGIRHPLLRVGGVPIGRCQRGVLGAGCALPERGLRRGVCRGRVGVRLRLLGEGRSVVGASPHLISTRLLEHYLRFLRVLERPFLVRGRNDRY